MKKPYISQFDRLLIKAGTLNGECLLLNLAIKKLERAIINKAGWKQ